MERTASLIEAETAAAPTAPSEQPTAAPAAQRSLLARVGGFVMGLCYWAMLAASTIGPGTITLMAKGGADMHAKKNYGDACLSWTILVASVIAYTLQESAARLQILTDTSFGAAMYVHFQARSESGRPKPPQPRNAVARAMGTSSCTPNVSLVMAGLIIFANTILECAQVAGMMAAVEYYGGKGTFTRTIVSFVVCITVAVVLFKGNIDSISKALGAVVALMAVVFTISSWAAGIDAEDFVPAMPADAADQSLGMIATTALPFNVFLASSLAQGFELKEMQTGVQFSTAVTAVISLLLIITGTAVENGPDGFHIADLAQVLRTLINPTGEAFFVGGLIAAAASSALTVALGASLSCQSLLSGGDAAIQMAAEAEEEAKIADPANLLAAAEAAAAAAAPAAGGDAGAQLQRVFSDPPGGPPVLQSEAESMLQVLRSYGWEFQGAAGQFAMGAALSMAEALRESLHLPTLKTITEQLSFAEQMSKKNEAGGGGRGRAESLSHTSSAENREANGESDALRELWNFDSARFRGVIMLQLLVSFVVVAAGLPTVGVIMLSQVIGGLLLPTISFCLLLVMNSKWLLRLKMAKEGRQDRVQNGMLVFATTSTAFLACKAVLPIITGTQVEHETGSQAGDSAEGPGAWLYIASTAAAITMLALSVRVVMQAEQHDQGAPTETQHLSQPSAAISDA